MYSSPHLQDFRERFRINNRLIGEEDFIALVNQLRPVIEPIPDITWFEVTTALAFLFFAQQKVDAAVIEVGLGGRLDATNVVVPVVSVITSLSYDHTYLLGDSLASIAREKGGIIKPGVPAVSAPQPPEALEVLAEIAADVGAPLTLVGRDWLYTPGTSTRDGQTFIAGPAGSPHEVYRTALTGEHQALNATVALAEAISGSEQQFVNEMNQMAAAMGLTATHYVNPHGLHDKAQVTSARDLAVLVAAGVGYVWNALCLRWAAGDAR